MAQVQYVPEKLWNKNYIFIILADFCLLLTFFMMTPNVAQVTATLGANKVQTGLASSIFLAGVFISRLWAGSMLDKMGMRKVLYLGIGFYFITCLLYFGAVTLDALLIVRFFHGLGYGVAGCVIAGTVPKVVPNDRIGEGLSWYQNSISLSVAIGPSLGVFAFGAAGANGLYIVCLVMTIVMAGIGSQLPNLRPAMSKERLAGKKTGFKINSVFAKTALPASILTFLLFFVYQNLTSFMLPYSAEVEAMTFGQTYFVIQSSFAFLSRVFTRNIYDKFNENKILYPVIISFIIGLVMLASAPNGYILLLSGVFIGVGAGCAQPTFNAIAVQLSSPEAVGRATGTFFAGKDIGDMMGPMIFGWLALSGYRTAWYGMAGVGVLLLFAYYFVHGRKVSAGTVVYLNKVKRKVEEPKKEPGGALA